MPAIIRCSVATASPAKRLVSRGIPGIQRAGVVRNTPNRRRLKAQPCSHRTYQELIQYEEDTMDGLNAIAKGSQTNLFVDHILPALAFSVISEGASAGIGNAFKKPGGYWKELGRASAHGTSNGLIRMAQGGKFEHGFFAGFVSSGVDSLHISGNVRVNTAISSSVGGASEAIGGGKFMNGAITGAYTYLFNHAAHLGNSKGGTSGPSEDAAGQVGEPYSLYFDGNRLMVVDESSGNVVYSTDASSGKGAYMNNPKYQNIEKQGPIPQGDYTFKKSQWKHQSILRQVYNIIRGDGDWGEYTAPLTPGNRHSFYIHGGFFEGSAGCIDAGLYIHKIYNYLKTQNVTSLRVRY